MKLSLPRSEWHAKIYFFGLALLLTCLPLSRYLLSIAQFVIVLNWIAEGNFGIKFQRIKRNTPVLLFASVFLIYAAGFLFSENTGLALEKVKNALPFLMLPIVMGSSEKIAGKNQRLLMILFSWAVVVASLVCLINYFLKDIPANHDFRQISIFMPHLRFALLIDMAIAILLYYGLEQPKNDLRSIAFFSAAVFLTLFLFFLRSATGIAIFCIIITVVILNSAARTQRKAVKYAIFLTVGLAFLVVTSTIAFTWISNFHKKPVATTSLETLTINGNPYSHDTASRLLENGNFTDLYICEPELRQEWNKVSRISYDSLDKKGQAIYSTLKRYLTSRGLRKDSAGLSQLTSADISNIEKGLTNYRFSQWPGISQRLYETLYEFDVYRKSGYVIQHSMGQRLVFLKTGLALAHDLFPSGTGTGDVYKEMKQKAQALKLEVDPKWEGKPHNQFIFLLLAFGFPGFIWILFAWIYPVLKLASYKYLLFNLFACIAILSMLIMDLLESYDSVVFFVFFYSLFLLHPPSPNSYT